MFALLIPLIASLAPQLLGYLFGAKAEQVASDVVGVVASVLPSANTTTPEGIAAMQAVLKADPAKAAELAQKLAEVAAAREAERNREADAQRKADLDDLAARLADTASARGQTLNLAQTHSPLAYGVAVISALVLSAFALVVWLAMTRELPASSATLLNILLGNLSAMAMSVVGYWVGTSANSGSKDAQLAAMNATVAASIPGDLAHALVRAATPTATPAPETANDFNARSIAAARAAR